MKEHDTMNFVFSGLATRTRFEKMTEGYWNGAFYEADLSGIRSALFQAAARLGEELDYGDYYPGITAVQENLSAIEVYLYRGRRESHEEKTFFLGFTAKGLDGNDGIAQKGRTSFLDEAYRAIYAVRVNKAMDEYGRERARIFFGECPKSTDRALRAATAMVSPAVIGANALLAVEGADRLSVGRQIVGVLRDCASEAEHAAAMRMLTAITQEEAADILLSTGKGGL